MAHNVSQFTHPAGTTLGYSTSAGGPYTTVDNLKSVNAPQVMKEVVDVTGVSESSQKQKRLGYQDLGDLEFACYSDNGAQLQALTAFYVAETLLYWEIQRRSGAKVEFTALISKIVPFGNSERGSNEAQFDTYTLTLTDDAPTITQA